MTSRADGFRHRGWVGSATSRRRVNPRVKMDISKGLEDGQEEGRTGVHVESEVVLNCDG